jgi:hypothetical protein
MTSPLNFPAIIIPTVAELQAFNGAKVRPNQLALVQNPVSSLNYSGPSTYQWQVGYAGSDATAQLVVDPGAGGTGKWVCVDKYFNMHFTNITFATADAAVLFTVPTGFRLAPWRFFMETGNAWSGGAGAIGVSSSNAAFNTKGDLMGGAAGDVAANMGAAGFHGTIGTKMAASYTTRPPVVLVAGDTIRWDVVVAGYNAGNGILNVPCFNIGS